MITTDLENSAFGELAINKHGVSLGIIVSSINLWMPVAVRFKLSWPLTLLVDLDDSALKHRESLLQEKTVKNLKISLISTILVNLIAVTVNNC